MLRNYFITALRLLKKNALFSVINILGLAIGLAASIIIFLWVNDELSYDKFHKDSGRIYRVERDMTLEDGRIEVSITSPPLGPQMVSDYPEIEKFVRLARTDVMVEDINRNQNKEQMLYADSSFFDIFSFKLINGDPLSCLKEPFTIVISRNYAQKYFGGIPETGSQLTLNQNGELRPYTVTGIFDDMPHNSHIKADLIGSFVTLYSLRHEMMMKSWMASSHYTYILLAENADMDDVTRNIQEMVDIYFGPELRNFIEVENVSDILRLKLRPLSKIHLEGNRIWDMEAPGSKNTVMVFSLVSFLLLIIAGINFVNLSTARASQRALEVGVRKVSGATKGQMVRQFLSESALFSFLALILAILLIELSLPYFSDFTGKGLSVYDLIKGWNFPVIISAWLFTAFLAGAYPAFFLSAYKPVDVLKGKKGAGGSKFFRRALVTGQFTVSIGLIICAVSVYRQLQYINNKDLGYNRYGLIDIAVEDRSNFNSFEAFKNELLSIPDVKNASRSMVIPTDPGFTDNPYKIRNNPDTFFPVVNRVDENFFPVFEISFLAGINFSTDMINGYGSGLFRESNSGPDQNEAGTSGGSVFYIINDAARRMFGFASPADAIGEEVGILSGPDGETSAWGQIVGVCEDFHFQPLSELIRPMVFSSSLSGHNHITVRIDRSDMGETIKMIQEIWKEYFPNQIFAGNFVSQNFDMMHLAERRLQIILLIFTFLSVFVACLGLLGLSAFSVGQRTKEIGIRKAMGAEDYQIIGLISGEFSRLLIISSLIAAPVAYFILREWVANFPYRRDIELWVFVAASLIGLASALLTVFLVTYRAAKVNPVETLRHE
jgi:putative ABC transport system permease protein